MARERIIQDVTDKVSDLSAGREKVQTIIPTEPDDDKKPVDPEMIDLPNPPSPLPDDDKR